MRRIIFVILFIVFFRQPLFALEPVILQEDIKQYPLGLHLEYLEDSDGHRTIDQVRSMDSSAWVRSMALVPNFGFSRSVFWVRVKLHSRFPVEKKMILEIASAILDYLDLYFVQDGVVTAYRTGERLPYHSRPVDHRNFIFNFSIAPARDIQILIRVANHDGIHEALPLIVWQPEAFRKYDANLNLILGIYLGILLIMIFYNLFVYFSVRDPGYLFYVLYIFCFASFFFAYHGLAFQLLWPESPWMANHSLFLFGNMSAIFLVFFVVTFLNLKDYSRTLRNLFGLFALAFLCGFLSNFFVKYSTTAVLLIGTTLPGTALIFIASFYCWKKGHKSSKYLILAFTVFLLGAFFIFLKISAALPSNFFTENALFFGSAMEVTLLSLGLADRINSMKAEKETAQREALALKDDMNTRLEQQVKERTEHLMQALAELKSAQSMLVSSEKKSALMKIAAGIAHELNNPLNYIAAGFSGFKQVYRDIQNVLNDILGANDNAEAVELKEYFKSQFSKSDKLMTGIQKGVEKSAAVISELRGVTGVDGDTMEELSILELIESALNRAQSQSREKGNMNEIRVTLNVSDTIVLELNRDVILQALKNVCMNSIYFSNQNSDPEIRISALWNNDESACGISIENNGPGITKDIEQKIFDGFVTTRDIGAGRGLGLFQSRSLLESIHGSIELTDNGRESGWVRFEIVIPVAAKRVPVIVSMSGGQ